MCNVPFRILPAGSGETVETQADEKIPTQPDPYPFTFARVQKSF